MPAFLLALLAGGTLIWVFSRSTKPRKALPGSTTTNVPTALVVLGDSLAVGLSPYLKVWATLRKIPIVVDAAVGRRTTQQRLDAVVPGSLVVVSLGTNDAVTKVNGTHLRKLAAGIRARGARAIIWLDPPATKPLPGLDVVHATIQSLPGALAVSTTAPIRGDGLHPSSYALVMRDLEPALQQAHLSNEQRTV